MEKPINPESQLVELDTNDTTWQINGKWYFLATKMSTERYEMLQRLSITFSLGISLNEIVTGLGNLFKLLNGLKFAEAAVLVHDMISAFVNVDKGLVHQFEACALLLNYEGENIKEYTEEIRLQKLRDFKEGGIDSEFFFLLAAKHIPDYLTAYKNAFQTISNQKNPS